MIGLAYVAETQKACPNLGHFTVAPPEMPSSTPPSWLRYAEANATGAGDRSGAGGGLAFGVVQDAGDNAIRHRLEAERLHRIRGAAVGQRTDSQREEQTAE